MAELKYDPVAHDQKAFLEKASKRRGFREAYDALESEYALANEMLSARTRAGLTQEAVAENFNGPGSNNINQTQSDTEAN